MAEDNARLQQSRGLRYYVHDIRGMEGYPPRPFHLSTAIHHLCGAVSATYESNEGLEAPNKFTAEEILIHHYCLFESLLHLSWRDDPQDITTLEG